MKLYRKWMTAFALVLSVFLFAGVQAQAREYKEYKDAYVEYKQDDRITAGYAYYYTSGGACGGYTYIYVKDGSTYRIANVRTNSKNLLAKKATEDYYKVTSNSYDYNTSSYGAVTTKAGYSATYIAYFAKKPGKYVVSFDIIDHSGSVIGTGNINVTAKKASSINTSCVKSIKYAGKDLWEINPYSTKKSGVLKVTLQKGYSLVSLEQISYKDQTADYSSVTYKKIKNGKKIKLATSRKYSYTTSSSGFSYEGNDLVVTNYIRITCKNKKTKEIETETYVLDYLNTK